MTYLPTDEDLALLKNHSSHVFCRIDLLNKNFVTIDSLEGVAIDGSISVDSTSDVRRTFNVTMYLGKNSNIANVTEEEWLARNIRVFIGLAGRTKAKISTKSAAILAEEDVRYKQAVTKYNKMIQDIISGGYSAYGNIDNLHRFSIQWTPSNIFRYNQFFEEQKLEEGSYSTVLGSDDPIYKTDTETGPWVAFTPMFQTSTQLIPLLENDIWQYLGDIVDAAKAMSGGLTPENILKADADGHDETIYNTKYHIKNMIAAVEGMTLNGAVLAKVDVSAIADWSEEELRAEYGTSSKYVGHSMHDIQADVADGKKELKDIYCQIFDEYAPLEENDYFDSTGIRWYNQGCFSFSSNGFTYNATTNTVQASCVDMVSRLNGDLAGQLAGNAHRIDKKADINKSIEAVMKESEFSKYCIDYWSRKVPHDLDYDTGTTTWQILTELRDLYYPFEMYFDDDVFVCREIPSGFNDPPVLEPELFASLVTSDGESATVDYTSVRNCIEVFGATIDADVFSDANNTTYSMDSNTLALKVSAASGSYQMNADGSNFSITSDTKVSFRAPANFTKKQLNFMVTFTAIYVNDKNEQETKTTSKTSILYAAVANADGQDKAQDPSVMVAGKYYVVQWNATTGRFYFVGQQQSHAMVKLVDVMPTADEIKKQKEEENCDNLKFICVNDPANIDSLYNSQMTVEKIGRRNEILSGGDYEGYTTDENTMEVAEYELWKRARLTDGLNVTTLLIPWLGVNEKIEYAAKYLNSNTPVEWIVKSFSINLGEGTMALTLSRYYPYYPFIVGEGDPNNAKHTYYMDSLMDRYFSNLTTASEINT